MTKPKHGFRNEDLILDPDGFGACRNCKTIIAKQSGRNLQVGFINADGEFVSSAILVSGCAFRCARCFARHQFQPFQPEQIKKRTQIA
jgi:hypothetical protein